MIKSLCKTQNCLNEFISILESDSLTEIEAEKAIDVLQLVQSIVDEFDELDILDKLPT